MATVFRKKSPSTDPTQHGRTSDSVRADAGGDIGRAASCPSSPSGVGDAEYPGTLGPAHASAPSPHVGELRMPKREFPKIKGTRVPYFNFGGPYNKDPTNEGATLNKRVPIFGNAQNFSRVAFPSRSSRARANQPPALWPMRMTGSPPESTVSSTFALARSKYHP